MKPFGVHVPPLMYEPSRAHVVLATAIWLLVSLPFFYFACLYLNWPQTVFVNWRGWIFAACAIACVLVATVVPPRYRLAIVGTRVRGWNRLL